MIDGYPEFELTEIVKRLDPTRLVDATSGWNDHGAGDFHVRFSLLCKHMTFYSQPDRTTTTTPTPSVAPHSTLFHPPLTILAVLEFRENLEGSATTSPLKSKCG